VAGSRGMVGAAVLVAHGAMRVGAGLVKLATVSSQQPVAAKRVPVEVTTAVLPESKKGLLSSQSWPHIRDLISSFRPDVMVMGPGLGQSQDVGNIVRKLLRLRIPVALDADGLNVLSRDKKISHDGPLIITPHPGEMARLWGVPVSQVQKSREFFAQLSARKFNCICVLKGAGTLVADIKELWKNPTGNPGMATGGTGDVLTGMIAGLWGQMPERDKENGFRAACSAVYLHGLASDLAVKKKTQYGMLASDLAEFVPRAFRQLIRA